LFTLNFKLLESILMVKKLLNLKLLIKLYVILSSLSGTDVRLAAVCSNILGCVDVGAWGRSFTLVSVKIG